jgi:hypothetical protein
VVFLCLLVLVAEAPRVACAQSAADEYRIKSAFLFHFAQFVEWPPGALNSGDASLNLCIFDDEPRLADLRSTIDGKPIGGRVFHVVPLGASQELRGCNMLFFSRNEARRQDGVLKRLRGQPVLTVGESASFLPDGGMIRFHIEENKIRFDVNLGASDASHLKISSQLLLLASVVIRSNGAGMGR